ncbi:MAG: PD40 domain-containing protein [Chloroflexi bacterium]|nr:PD40 domain-containing protein [Chloroflexota bacterium]
MTLERGTLLHKRYRIVEILGQGGMGSVYRAVDENLGVDVAVKENLFTTDEYSRQFRLEAVILANLRHPNMPRVSDHFVMGDTGQYLVMDFIEGEDLRQRMERMGTVTEDDAVMVGAAICDALTYLHTRKPPILHRDIKPGNVKITPEGHIFLVDFGLAKVVQGSQATTTGARAMTPGYSPPEQYGTARTDPRTDIYSLGATLYAALCGMIPEDGLARAMDNAQLTPLRKRNTKISRRLAAAIEKAMAIDPADRFQLPDDFKKALLNSKSKTQHLNGEFTISPPPDVPDAPSEGKKEKKSEPKSDKPGVPPPPPPMDEDKPFIPPNKRRRGKGAWLWFLLLLLIAVFLAVAVLYPSVLPANFRNILPFGSPTSTATLLPTDVPNPTEVVPVATQTASSIPSSPTFTITPTKIPLEVATETLIPAGTPTESPTPGPTPVGGGLGQIAFASDRSGIPQIYLSDLIGNVVRPLTNMPGGACQPSWSPDGSRLVFVSPCSRRADITEPPTKDSALYIINADGSNQTPLPAVPGADFEPAWAPDGNRIAFTSLRDGYMQVYVYNLTDQTVARLTNTPSGNDARQPAWSPFSNQIAYVVKRFGAYQIWTMTDAGQGQQQIVRSGQQFWDYLPAWSPDGKTIIFNQRNAGGPVQPWIMSITYENRNIEQAARLKLGTLPIQHIHYSPDGNWLVFEGQSDGENKDIFVTAAGEQRTRLTKDPGVDFDPAWRPASP